MGAKLYIDSTQLFEEVRRDGTKFLKQEARMPVPGKPTEHFLITLDQGQVAYPVGEYEFSPVSFRRGEYGGPMFAFRVVLEPSSQAKQKPAAVA